MGELTKTTKTRSRLCRYLEKEPEIQKLLEKQPDLLQLIMHGRLHHINREVEGEILRFLEKEPKILSIFKEIKANSLPKDSDTIKISPSPSRPFPSHKSLFEEKWYNHIYIQTQNIVLSSYLSLTIAVIT